MKFLVALAFVASVAAQCTINPTSGTSNQTCNGNHCIITKNSHPARTCNGNRYIISANANCVNGGCGLIFDVHGFTMTSEQQNSGTQLRQYGTDAGYVVVHPQASGLLIPSWSESDDKNVLQSLLDIADAFNVDKSRIHFGGFSQGGWMTWRMICNTANLSPAPRDVIASFAPIAAGLGGEVPTCFGAGQVGNSTSILHTHGRLDYAVFFTEALATVRFIEAAQGPSGTKQVLHDETFYDRTRYDGNGIRYETLFHGSSHCMVFPGGSGLYNCNGPFTTGLEILDFYKSTARK